MLQGLGENVFVVVVNMYFFESASLKTKMITCIPLIHDFNQIREKITSFTDAWFEK